MYKIYKTSLHSAIDYAAEELKKYLRMMMPDCGEIPVFYDPNATDGFRLGLMQNFGLDVSDVEEPVLDDILYMDTDAQGGIIAGDNPRSVLLSVYEYLRQLGCRWLFPGVDGEFIPMVSGLTPVKLRHVPSCRFRGQCNEGAEYQQGMLDAIEFTPKVGMNVFMLEFRIPTSYYKRYYNHLHNADNRPPEPVTFDTILQWKRACEDAIAKRGLLFNDIGHGWGADAFGIDSSLRNDDGDNEKAVPAESRKYLAMINGERKLAKNTPNFTQFCMSNKEARDKVVQYAASYAQKHTNVDYLHFWLGDASNSHCECENCLKKTPADWYMILLNELDAELTRRNLDTRVAFSAYTDTLWAPETERLNNPSRFNLLFAPITRSYTEPLSGEADPRQILPFNHNKNVMPKSPEGTFAYFNKWKEVWKGPNMAYEYHFWKHQYYDVANIQLAKVVNEDIRGYKRVGINGLIEDGSQRSFFPTGNLFYTYARTLYDNSLTDEQIAKDYFSCAFGKDWEQFYGYMKKLDEVFDFAYLEGMKPAEKDGNNYYNPALAEKFAKVKDVVAEGRELIKAHYNMPYRVQTVSVRLLELHAFYCELLAEALIQKCQGNDDEADILYAKLKKECGKYEVYFQNCYDQALLCHGMDVVFNSRTKITEPLIY